MYIILDGRDNTATINGSMYAMLKRLGIIDRNELYAFHVDGDRYAFCICPPDMNPKDTVTTSLMYNTHFKTFGFELLCPTVQSIFFRWSIPDPDSKVKVRIRPKIINNNTIFMFAK